MPSNDTACKSFVQEKVRDEEYNDQTYIENLLIAISHKPNRLLTVTEFGNVSTRYSIYVVDIHTMK